MENVETGRGRGVYKAPASACFNPWVTFSLKFSSEVGFHSLECNSRFEDALGKKQIYMGEQQKLMKALVVQSGLVYAAVARTTRVQIPARALFQFKATIGTIFTFIVHNRTLFTFKGEISCNIATFAAA